MNRRLIAIILAACLALCLFGCGREEQPSLETPTTTEPTVTTEPEVGTEENVAGAKPLDDTTNATEQPNQETQEPTEPPTSGNQEQITQGTTEPTEKPTENTDATEPDGGNNTTEPGEGNVATGATAYEQYYNMSGEEQKAFIESFDSIEAFFEWHTAAKAEYEKLHPDIEIDGGSVDLGGGNG